ncbi:MAG: hypothetical protein H6744_15680, partial [Deltaproteobacteria bacterium]|nr:hypothetical protein [Deltaproteobacteria bacterium]
MKRFLIGVATVALVGLGSGCGGCGSSGNEPDTDTAVDGDVSTDVDASEVGPDGGGDADVSLDADATPDTELGPDVEVDGEGDADVSVDADAEVGPDGDADTETVSCNGAPTLSFWFDGSESMIGLGDSEVTLYPEDEADADLTSEGFQLAVVVNTHCVPDGTALSLTVGDAEPITGTLAVTGEAGAYTFEGVTFPPGLEPGYAVTVVAEDPSGTLTEAKTVVADLEPCSIEVVAGDGESVCVHEDADGSVPGLQMAVTVRNPDGRCDRATLEVSTGEVVGSPTELLLVGGEAQFLVTVSGSEDPAEVDVNLVAQVLHPVSPGLTGSDSVDARFDQVPPSLQIVSPDPTLGPITLDSDENDDPADGLQISVSGQVSGSAGDGSESLQLFAGETLLATTTPEGGSFVFAGVTVEGNGPVELSVKVSDTCDNVATAAVTVDIFSTAPALTIQAPIDGETLKAVVDAVPATTDVFDGTFQVAAPDVTDGSVVEIECRPAGSAGVFEMVGSTTVDQSQAAEGSVFEIQVALPVATLTHDTECHATATGPNPVTSNLVTLVIGVPGPSLTLTQPLPDARLTTASVEFGGTATGLDGQSISVTVIPGGGGEPVCTASGGAIETGVLSGTIDLDAACGALADGTWFLQIDAVDQYGNALSELAGQPTVSVRLDRTDPGLVRIAPPDVLDPKNVAADADVAPGAENPGYQTDFEYEMTGETDPDGAEVCLEVDGNPLGCQAVDPLTFKAQWKRVTLSSGDNSATAVATDAFGNTTTLTQNIELLLDAPVVKILTPAANLVTVKPTLDVKVSVSDPNSGLPVPGAVVSLRVDDGDSGITPVGNGDGTFTFVGVPLVADTAVTIQAVANFGGTEGASGLRTITYKTTKPTVSLSGLTDGQLLTLASSECLGTGANCLLSLDLDTTNAEDDSTVTLAVDCVATSGDKTYTKKVTSGTATIADVMLVHGGVCTLTPKVVDLAGQLVTGDVITVTVDRVAPKLLAFINPSGDKLLFNQDANANPNDGMQHPLSLRVTGVEAGQVVSVLLSWTDPVLGPQTLGPLTHTVTANVADGTPYVAAFADPPEGGTITYPEGTITLTATVSDAAGNSAQLAKTILVESFAPSIRIVFPVYLGGISCGPSVSCPGGSCFEGHCWTQWGIAETKQVSVTVGGVITTTDNVRVCSDHPTLAGDGVPCASEGYFEVVRASVDGDSAIIPLGGKLPSGYQTIIAETQAEPGGAWTASLDEVNPLDRFRRVFVDEVAPTVDSLQITSDSQAPLGTLNIAEQIAPGRTYRVRVATSEEATVDVYVNSVLRGTATTTSGIALLSIAFDEGQNVVYAVARDGANNKSGQPPATPSLTVTVDTKVPSLVFTSPTKSPLLAGDSLDVTLESDSPGAVVALFDGIVEIGSETVTGGTVTFA